MGKELIDSLITGSAPLPPVNPDIDEDEKEEDDDERGSSKPGPKKKVAKTPPNYHQDYVSELERHDDVDSIF